MSNDIARLQQEIDQLKAAIAQLAGQPNAQQPLQIALGQREQQLARLRGLAASEPPLPLINLIARPQHILINDEGHITEHPAWSPTMLHDLFKTIRTELLRIVSASDAHAYGKQRKGSPERCAQILQTMAQFGYMLWQLLFQERALQGWAQQLRERGRQQPFQLNLLTPGMVIPWQLIYDRDPRDGVVLEGFWGLYHRLMLSSQRSMPSLVAPSAHEALRVLAGYYLPFAEESGDAQMLTRQQALIQRLAPDRVIVTSDTDFIDVLRMGSDARLLYLFCHVDQQGPALVDTRLAGAGLVGSVSTRIILSKGGGISLHELMLVAPLERAACLSGHPLVFLNACSSAAQSPLSDVGLTSFFFQHGAQALIGSECKLPVLFGDLFGELMLEALCVPGQSLGAALQRTRHTLLEQYHNPLGLLYTLLGRADMCLIAPGRQL